METLFRQNEYSLYWGKPTNSQPSSLAGDDRLPDFNHQNSNLKLQIDEHWVRWSWKNGREHGAPVEGSEIQHHCGLRYESQNRDGTSGRTCLRGGAGFVASNGGIGCDLYRRHGRQRDAANFFG